MPWQVFWYLVFQLSACGISLEWNVAPVWLTHLVPFLSYCEQKVWDQGLDVPRVRESCSMRAAKGGAMGDSQAGRSVPTSGLTKRAGQGWQWGLRSVSAQGSVTQWLQSLRIRRLMAVMQLRHFQVEWGAFDKDPCSISSSQLWPRHGRWSEHRQPKLSEKERGPWPSRYTQSLARVLPNLKEELNAAARLPATPGGLNTSQCHQQGSPWSAMPLWGHS